MQQDIIAYFDGACEPRNPGGHMGMGAVVQYADGTTKELISHKEAGPENSNNVAEYLALTLVLDELMESIGNDRGKTIEIFGDSKLVINQMSNFWEIKSGFYFDAAVAAYMILAKIRERHFVHFCWIPRDRNEWADSLSKKSISKLMENTKLTDESIMPFGIHKGKQLADVPAAYLVWLLENGKAGSVGDYIRENLDVLKVEVKREASKKSR